ncbi:MAG: transglutaminase domain-containing protein [Akkermansiaceae bacterium]|nr:transglutaminase domain-containing protein [Akkermansiaceae bacterium]
MKPILPVLLVGLGTFSAAALEELPESIAPFVQHAQTRHGDFGKRAASHLLEHMPASDLKRLNAEFLSENLDLAMQAREQFPWAAKVPEALFFNDVLPYAVLDEPRHPWRAEFLKLATPIVKDAKTAEEAAQLLNQHFFDKIGVHYDTGRKRANQSPQESIEQGRASCSGLSIILVNACRAVGIPARAAGIPMWPDKRGNHTWVEIHDGEAWRFTGADEYDAKGLDRAWFTQKAAEAQADRPLHAIYATSWEPKGTHFPLPWNRLSQQVGAVNVTARYAAETERVDQVGIRLFANADRGSRIAVKGYLLGGDGVPPEFTTKAGTTDLNDMPQVPILPGIAYRLVFEVDGKTFQSEMLQFPAGTSTLDLRLDELKPIAVKGAVKGLTQKEAVEAGLKIYQELLAEQREQRAKELEAKSITIGEHEMKWLEKTFGDAPEGERSLWISMHGGGGAPPRVNDQQWRNQIKLYQPKEGIYVAPRAPTNTWNLWHQAHIDPLFNRLIENMIALRGVDPNKVYLMGYSAGGDGVWQLAPRMADRFAAASMMAGHPNEAKMLGLRNLPFGIFCGSEDRAHKRNEVCAQRMKEIKEMAEADPGGYVNMTRLYKGLPHWMNLKDAESVPWMADFTRQTWPKKLVWYQDDVTHDRFYWLELPEGKAEKGQRIEAEIEGQTITLQGDVPMGTRILLHDALLDLDQPILVKVNDRKSTTVEAKRSAEVMRAALEKRLDPKQTPTAVIVIE